MPHQNFRASEYAAAGVSARWLDEPRARNAYAYGLQFSSSKRYGLSEATVRSVERLVIESYSVADAWMRDRIHAEGTVQVVYGEAEVAVLAAADFLAKWREIFVPGRDDAIVLHNLSSTVLFYSHQDELEVGVREA